MSEVRRDDADVQAFNRWELANRARVRLATGEQQVHESRHLLGKLCLLVAHRSRVVDDDQEVQRALWVDRHVLHDAVDRAWIERVQIPLRTTANGRDEPHHRE
ncbi:MAG: hypothetical protein JRI98_09960 [Deltaproteobacteria bacterium]|nr:hypothetical protein [Deltaproteobacteria bacterium]